MLPFRKIRQMKYYVIFSRQSNTEPFVPYDGFFYKTSQEADYQIKLEKEFEPSLEFVTLAFKEYTKKERLKIRIENLEQSLKVLRKQLKEEE